MTAFSWKAEFKETLRKPFDERITEIAFERGPMASAMIAFNRKTEQIRRDFAWLFYGDDPLVDWQRFFELQDTWKRRLRRESSQSILSENKEPDASR